MDTVGQGEKIECDDNYSKIGMSELSSQPLTPSPAAFPPVDLFSGTFQLKAPHLCRRGPGSGELLWVAEAVGGGQRKVWVQGPGSQECELPQPMSAAKGPL